MNILGQTIRCLRNRKGWRQKDLAEKACVSEDWINRLEVGNLAHLGEWLAQLRSVAAALGLSLNALLLEAGVTEPRVEDFERGGPSLRELVKGYEQLTADERNALNRLRVIRALAKRCGEG